MIAKEVDDAMKEACKTFGAKINEFHVAPQVNPPEGGTPYHEWFIEFEETPPDLEKFTLALDQSLVKQNIYYKDLIDGRILRPLKVNALRKGAFQKYMKSIGKLGEQNKVPRLKNDRSMADALIQYI